MRAWSVAWLALVLVPLSGCTQGDNGGTSSAFVGSCPAWSFGEHPLGALTDTQLHNPQTPGQTTRTDWDNTFPFDSKGHPAVAPPDQDGKKADQYQLHFPAAGSNGPPIFVENGTLTFRVFNNYTGEQLSLYDPAHPETRVDHVTYGNGIQKAVVWQVDLVPPTQDPKPAPIRLEATFTAADGYVIGTGQSGTGHDRAGAIFSVEPYVHYRAMGCVQK